MKKFIASIPVGILSILITLLIAYLSLASNPFDINDVPLFPGFDKVAHFCMYFGCAVVYIFDYAKFKLPHHTSWDIELALTATTIVVGLLMECAQMVLTTTRSFEIIDWFADCAGAIVAFFLMHYALLHFVRKSFYGIAARKRRHSHSHKHYETDAD